METDFENDPEKDGIASVGRYEKDKKELQISKRKYRGQKKEIWHAPTIDPCKTETALEGIVMPLGLEVLQSVVMKSSIFWFIKPLYSVESESTLVVLTTCFRCFLAHLISRPWRFEATCFSETSDHFQQTKQALYLRRQFRFLQTFHFSFYVCLFCFLIYFFVFVQFCVCLGETEEVSLLPIKVYVLQQQDAVFAILFPVTALGILFSSLCVLMSWKGNILMAGNYMFWPVKISAVLFYDSIVTQ